MAPSWSVKTLAPNNLRDVSDDIGPGRVRVLTRDRRQVILGRHVLAYLLFGVGGAEVEVEVSVRRRDPGNAPTHPLLVRLKPGQRSPRNEQQGHVAGMKVRQ